eukprot:gene22120-biopygen11715
MVRAQSARGWYSATVHTTPAWMCHCGGNLHQDNKFAGDTNLHGVECSSTTFLCIHSTAGARAYFCRLHGVWKWDCPNYQKC